MAWNRQAWLDSATFSCNSVCGWNSSGAPGQPRAWPLALLFEAGAVQGRLEKRVTDPRICIFGAAPDTGNLGVSALLLSTLNAVVRWRPRAEVTVFDHGRGVRSDEVLLQNSRFRFSRIGANLSRRYYRRDSLLNMRLSATLGGLGNPGLRALREADAVLDISGGDSFADLYGVSRFRAITVPKRMTMDQGSPLYLLPQTYGPYEAPRARAVARGIVCDAAMAIARDERSFEILRDLLGERYDPARHSAGVDVAFALPCRAPDEVPEWFSAWTSPEERRGPVVGFNISGLIYNAGAAGSRRFGFKGDYSDIVHGVLERFLAETDASIALVPHVLTERGHYEDDVTACQKVASTLDVGDRLRVMDRQYDAMEMKWVVSRLDFFCGTRMHSTIAGLSSGVPTSAIAYSGKTRGVFETCGQGDCVTDPRQESAERCVGDVWRIWEDRADHRNSLAERLPSVLGVASAQFERIFADIESRH